MSCSERVSAHTRLTPLQARRQWLRGGLVGMATALGWPALGVAESATVGAVGTEGFPRRPISLWVPWAPGGATDLTLRVLAELAGQRLGQRVVIQNRGGAGGTLAMPVLQQAAPDGYTLAQMPQTVFRAPWTHPVAWDPIRDTTPVIQVSGVTFGVVVPLDSPIQTIADMLAWARSHPGELTVATNGVGTTPHVVLDEWLGKLGLTYVHVPYKGVAEQMLGVASGQVKVGVGANGFAPYVDTGRVRLLATMAARRSPRWKDVPTLQELGHGIVATSPYGIAGPGGMSPGVVQVLHDAFRAAMLDPVHLAELAKYDQELAYLGPQAYGQAMRAAMAAEQATVERLGLGKQQAQ